MAATSSVNLKQFLTDYNKSKVRIGDEERKVNLDVAKNIVESFVKRMKEADPLFKELYQRIFYAGSSYEGLKVGAANEFDLNIVLNLPFKQEDVEVVHNVSKVPKGFVMYKLKGDCCLEKCLARHPKWPVFMALDKLMDESHIYFSQSKVNAWFQSLVDKTLLANQEEFRNVKRSCNGPAKTLNITHASLSQNVDVDLVPVVQLAEFPKSVDNCQLLNGLRKDKCTCFIVPKPPPSYHVDAFGKDAADKFFRVSIPDAERLLMENKGCIKMLVKIFKAIRDNYNLKFIASYYIKTVFMWQLVKHPDTGFWKQENQDKLFLMMLNEFVAVMRTKGLDHIFFKGYNLLAGLPPGSLDQAKIRFESVLKLAESDVLKLYQLFGITPSSAMAKIAAAPKM